MSRASMALKKDSSHHAAIECRVIIPGMNSATLKQETRYDFSRANIPAIRAALSPVDWPTEFRSGDVDENVERFYVIVNRLIQQFVPRKSARTNYRCPWMNRNLASCRNRRNRAHKTYKRNPTNEN